MKYIYTSNLLNTELIELLNHYRDLIIEEIRVDIGDIYIIPREDLEFHKKAYRKFRFIVRPLYGHNSTNTKIRIYRGLYNSLALELGRRLLNSIGIRNFAATKNFVEMCNASTTPMKINHNIFDDFLRIEDIIKHKISHDRNPFFTISDYDYRYDPAINGTGNRKRRCRVIQYDLADDYRV